MKSDKLKLLIKLIYEIPFPIGEPDVDENEDGGIVLEWIDTNDVRLCISIEENSIINFAAIIKKERLHGQEHFKEELSNSIHNAFLKYWINMKKHYEF